MRMSGLSKVEMSGFAGGLGRHAEADHADRNGQAAEDQRSPYPSAAGWLGEHDDRAVIHGLRTDEDQTAG
jgi:hypothetical protein